MEHRYYLGMDGGGTKTDCVLYDAETDELSFCCGGPTNHEVLPGGLEELPAAVCAAAEPLLRRAGIGPEALRAGAFGLGGVDTPIQQTMITQVLAGMGFGRFALANDAYLGIQAECGGVGIAAVNGSGYSVVGINRAGQRLQIGAHSEMTGDKGGGDYLVPAVVRAAYTQLFKDGPQTAMTQMLFRWAGAECEEDFCQAVALRILSDRAGAYAEISRILYRASAQNDAEARRILTECGEDYALSVRCVADKLKMEGPIDVALLGSQFTKCEDACAIEALRRTLDPVRFRLRLIGTRPVAGALLWALELGGEPRQGEAAAQLKARVRAAKEAE
jgi:N-acetylglucosamine kinase-like BadF-type ATPase